MDSKQKDIMIEKWLESIVNRVRDIEKIGEMREEAYKQNSEGRRLNSEAIGALIGAVEAIYTNSLKRKRNDLLNEVVDEAKEIAQTCNARIRIHTRIEFDYFFRRSEGTRIELIEVTIPIVDNPEREDSNNFREYVLDLDQGKINKHEYIMDGGWTKKSWQKEFAVPYISIVP